MSGLVCFVFSECFGLPLIVYLFIGFLSVLFFGYYFGSALVFMWFTICGCLEFLICLWVILFTLFVVWWGWAINGVV